MLKNKPFWIALVVLAAYLLTGYFAGPLWLQPGLKEFVSSQLGRELHFSQLRFDPITLSLELEQVKLLANAQSPWPDVALQADEVEVRFSFWRLSPAIANLVLTAPVVELPEQSEQPYPFVSGWQQWTSKSPQSSKGDTLRVARWRVQAGRVATSTGEVLLDEVNLQFARADASGLREFELEFSTAGEAGFSAQGGFNPSDLSAFGAYHLSVNSIPPAIAGLAQAEGKFRAEFQGDWLHFQLSDNHVRSDKATICWQQNLLCAQIHPVDGGFAASGVAAINRLAWQDFKIEMQAFQLLLNLGQGRVELLRPLAFSTAGIELLRQQPILPASLAGTAPAGFDIRLDTTGEWQADSAGFLDPSAGTAEMSFQVKGPVDFNAFIRMQEQAAQPSQAAYTQLELQVQNPGAGLAREFLEQHLSGQLAADNFGLQILANQDEQGLELVGQVSLARPGLKSVPASEEPGRLDPEWLLAMWQNRRGNVELDLPQQMIDMRQRVTLRQWLETEVLELLLESSESPFESLARQTRSDTGLPQEITFPAGSAAPGTEDDQALSALGTALALRPGLSLDVPAVYDPLIDNKALQTEQVRTHIALAGAAELEFQSGTEPTDFTDPVVHSVIDEFARQRLPAPVLAAFFEHFGQADVDQGVLPEGDIAAYYAALFELLVDHAEIPQAALNSLAKYRAQAVVDGLIRQGVERQRLHVSDQVQTSAAGMGGVPLRLTLGVSVDPATDNPTPEPGVEQWE